MEEMQNKIVKAEVDNCSISITKGYGYINKDGKQRYTVNETYYVDGDKVSRKYENEKGVHYFPIELIDVVIETFVMKDGRPGSKTYPLSETPYLAKDVDSADVETLTNFLKFKLHK